MLKKLYKISFYLFFAFLPFQLDVFLFGSDVYDSGFFNPYLSHFLYLSDIILIFGLVFFGLDLLFSRDPSVFKKFSFGDKKIFSFLCLMILSFVISLFFSVNLMNSIFYIFRFCEFFVVYLLVVNEVIDFWKVLMVFCSVMFLEAIIGISQYVLQESLGLRFFGEPVVNSSILGVAKVDFMNMKFLRSYGTFPHPNIFAGYLVFAIFSMIQFFKNSPKISFFYLSVSLLALFLTFSRTGILSLVVGVFVFSLFVFKKLDKLKMLKKTLFIVLVAMFLLSVFKAFPLLIDRINFIDVESLKYRIIYLVIGFAMFFQNPFGVGLGNFTDVMQNFSVLKLSPWEIQPVHNIFVLTLSEVGIIGFIVLVSFFVYLFVYSFKKKNPFFISVCFMILILGSFDHYLFTLYQGQALFWLSICALYPFKNSLSDIWVLPSN